MFHKIILKTYCFGGCNYRASFWKAIHSTGSKIMSSDVLGDNWNCLECSKEELNINITLACGQAFRWRESSPGEWLGVFASHVWRLRQTDTALLYKVYDRRQNMICHPAMLNVDVLEDSPKNVDSNGTVCDETDRQTVTDVDVVSQQSFECSGPVDYRMLLHDYFRLSVNLKALYEEWGLRDDRLLAKTSSLQGIRQLRQDPVETLFTFICSSNNNIGRIAGMVERMCEKYGESITEVDGKTYFDFPRLKALAADHMESGLRELGFGYRAAYISQTARCIVENHSVDFLNELRNRPYEEAKFELMKFHGVGAKVADCVCLMSLDKLEAVPVDTHVWQLAVREYRQSGISSAKSLNDTIYRQIGNFFRSLWGSYAGWAQSVAFTAELKQFQQCLQPLNQKVVGNIKLPQKQKKPTTASCSRTVKKKKSNIT